ncbi:hypothetical protein C2S51_020706 [Perilla frutescens var. frutescens]|nr:hypothetical protein C2S51_020706 [Perilla frutescens var. frutescens]
MGETVEGKTVKLSRKKEGIVEIEEDFSSPTPVKKKEPSRIQTKDELPQLPERYAALLEFFGRMMSSSRLLNLRKKTPTFQNVSSQIEILTGRKFLPSHLAQIKYILPEAVQIDKILTHDEKTKCMKSEIKIGLLFDAVKYHHEESVYVALSNIFSSRLRDFNAKHPEACDVPEAELPEPFSQGRTTVKEYSISEMSPALCETEMLNSSHLPPSFQTHFNQKAATVQMEKTDILSPVKSACEVNEVFERVRSPPGSYSAADTSETTPMKPLVGSDCLAVETPSQSTPLRPILPARSVLTCEDENKTTSSHKQSTATAKKSLDFNSMDGEDTTISYKRKSVRLSDLVLLIHQIFQSVKFNPITKEELVQKIIMNSFEFDDHGDVETQMENLEKLVPDWFCKKMTPSGDLLYNVRKVLNPNSVCERMNAI